MHLRKKAAKGKKQILIQTKLFPREGTRRSARKVSEPKTSYNTDIHPQDKFLIISSDDDEEYVPIKKRRKLTHAPAKGVADSNGEATEPEIVDEESVQRIESGGSDSDRQSAPVSSETGQDQGNGTIQFPSLEFLSCLLTTCRRSQWHILPSII